MHNEDWFSGGKQTVFSSNSGAFSEAFPVMRANAMELHDRGDILFEAKFISDPSRYNYGLGPLYNNISCVSCHVGDGRGKAPLPGDLFQGMLLRISIDGTDPHGGPNPAPGFGGQLQQRSIVGTKPEVEIAISYTEQEYQFPDGEKYFLRKPEFQLNNPYIPLPANYHISPRMASPVFGLGLLEAVPVSTVLAWADPDDANGDGISGKANMVWSVLDNKAMLGRFGWKAGQPTVLQQSAGAANQDMGVTNYVFPVENSFGQSQFAYSKGIKEISDSNMYALAYYVRTLAVPGRRNAANAEVKQGQKLFNLSGCNACHKSDYFTGFNMAEPEFNYQRIFPYTDLLLHDMGAGLADNRTEFLANGVEWRTAPLWGIGLTRVVNGHNNFLHDGRARNLIEAIMWHGGEAENSKNKFAALSKAERMQLLSYLESL